MKKIRQEKLKCDDEQRIEEFIKHARTGYLGLYDGNFPYVVPLNFVWMNGAIYFHGAAEGRKIRLIQENANCCFTIAEEYGTMVSPVPAKTSTAYMSVMMFGKVEIIHDLIEATEALQAMLDKYVPGYYGDRKLSPSHVEKYRSSLGSHTVVFKIVPEIKTAKENPFNPERAFIPDRNIKTD